MTVERHSVPLGDERIALVLHLPAGPRAVPCVVACHGLQASKDSDKYLLLADVLSRSGLALARFDFRGSGESTGVYDQTTVGTRVEDLCTTLKWLEAHPRLDGRFGLVGSSMGGFVALHVAAERGDAPPVVTWNAPANLSEFERTDRPVDLGLGLPFALELASERYLLAPGVPRHLVIHGDADDVVPLEHGTVLHSRAVEPCDFVVIAGADHRLSQPSHRAQAVDATRAWFERHLLA